MSAGFAHRAIGKQHSNPSLLFQSTVPSDQARFNGASRTTVRASSVKTKPSRCKVTPASRSEHGRTSPLIRSKGRNGVQSNRAPLRCVATENGSTEESPESVENVVIIGSGPAGYTASIYAARASLRPLCFEGFQAGGIAGGQLMTTTEVENFPGFPEGISGPDLMDRMRKQAERWGAVLHGEDVVHVDTSVRPFVVRSTDREVRTHSIIVATGATAKRLGIPSEHEFWSRGISACAICDGASPLFKGQEVAVVGGGDTATEEAVYLTKYCSKVHLLVRGAKMRASKAMQERALAHPKVQVHMNTEVDDAYGDKKGQMAGLALRDAVTGETRKLEVRGFFYGIGHTPNSQLFEGQLERDASGYLMVGEGGATNVPGVYSAGDVHDTEWRQAVTAAGSGCAAAISVERYLVAEDLMIEHKPDPETVAAPAAAAPAGASSSAAEDDGVEEADAETFDPSRSLHRGQFALRKLYHESTRVLGVLYTAPSCGPCRRLKPMLRGVVDEYGEAVHFVEIDIEADPEIAEAAGVSGTPRVDWFKNKERIAVMNGVKMKSEYRKLIDENIDRPQEPERSEAREEVKSV